jgi:PhnB protein
MATVDPIPAGYPRVTPYLCAAGAAAAIEFYREVFGATQRGDAMTGPDGKIGHAEIEIGDALLMIADEYPDIGFVSPKTVGGTPVLLHVYVEDVDATVERAVAAGATILRPAENHFYGDRSGEIEDPFGHRWNVSSHIEDVAPDEMARRAAELADQS